MKLTDRQYAALGAMQDGEWMGADRLSAQGHYMRTLFSLESHDLIDRDNGAGRFFRFRINEAGRDAHYRR